MKFVVIAMPWFPLNPSIQLGIIATALEAEGIEVVPVSAYLRFYELLRREAVVATPNDYARLSVRMEAAEWAFSDDTDDAGMEQILGEDFVAARKAKDLVPAFLDSLAEEVLAHEPDVVGFTLTFAQSVASLQLAKRLKALNPRVKIVFGGPVLMYGVGDALLRNYDFIDAVYYGEAEGDLVRFLRGESTNAVSTREKAATELSRVPGDDFAVPNYDEFFQTIDRLGISELKTSMKFPLETGRGCWWGFKHACTFCAEDVAQAPYRAKPWRVVVDEVKNQARRYNTTFFYSVDSVIDYKHSREMLEALAAFNFDFFFPVKSNIGLREIEQLKNAGAVFLQPGIESLSTPILRLMSKGVASIQNVRFLKFCEWLGMRVSWAFIVGFLGEEPSDYAAMTTLSRNLQHLHPPQEVTPFWLYRGSKIFNDPEGHGIRITGPLPVYKHLYALPESELRDIAFSFQYEYIGDRNHGDYTSALSGIVQEWRRHYYSYKHRPSLRYHVIEDRVVVIDERPGRRERYELDPNESAIYRAAFDIVAVSKLPGAMPAASATLQMLESRGLLVREDDLVLSLALPTRNP